MKEFFTFGPDDISFEHRLHCGPSIWLKMSADQRFGSGNETSLYHKLCKLSAKGRPYVVIPSKDEKDTTVILAFEFMVYELDGEPTTTDFREHAQGYTIALAEMTDQNYTEIDTDDLDAVIEFCRGFKNSSII